MPAIKYLQNQIERWVNVELVQAKRRLAKGAAPQDVLGQFAVALSNKFLHGPRHALNHLHGTNRRQLIKLLEFLFHHRKNDG